MFSKSICFMHKKYPAVLCMYPILSLAVQCRSCLVVFIFMWSFSFILLHKSVAQQGMFLWVDFIENILIWAIRSLMIGANMSIPVTKRHRTFNLEDRRWLQRSMLSLKIYNSSWKCWSSHGDENYSIGNVVNNLS